MLIGRLGIHKGSPVFEWTKAACGCLIFESKLFSITWYARECRCVFCNSHECICGDQ